MVYHFTPKANCTFKPRALFWAGLQVPFLAQVPEALGVSGLNARP